MFDEVVCYCRVDCLVLVVRVLDWIEVCIWYGMDVVVWVCEQLIDFVMSARVNDIDFDVLIELFVRFCWGTLCRLFFIIGVSYYLDWFLIG